MTKFRKIVPIVSAILISTILYGYSLAAGAATMAGFSIYFVVRTINRHHDPDCRRQPPDVP